MAKATPQDQQTSAKARPIGRVRLGGRAWEITLGFNAFANLAELGDATVRLVFDVLARRRTDAAADFAATRAMLWAGMRSESPDLTTEIVGEWIDEYLRDGGDYAALAAELLAAWDMPRLSVTEDGGKNAPPETATQ